MSGWRYVCFLIFAWVSPLSVSAYGNPLDYHHLGIQDGLSQATNAYIYKDTKGFVWISSISGLNRYDGMQVKVYMPDKSDPASLFGENIQSNFYEDNAGGLWFCTYEAIHKYNWDQDCFDHYQVIDSTGTPVVGYHIFFMDQDQNLWFLLDNEEIYTFHIPTGTFQKSGSIRIGAIRCFVSLTPDGQVTKLLLQGRTWAGIDVAEIGPQLQITKTYPLSDSPAVNVSGIQKVIAEGDSVAWIITPIDFVRHSLINGQERTIPFEQGRGFFRLSDSTFYLASADHGLVEFNTRTWNFQGDSIFINTGPWQQPEKITYFNLDRDGTIWLSANGTGIRYAHPQMNKFRDIRFSDFPGIPANSIPVAFFEDRLGHMLCFTKLNGVFNVDFGPHHTFVSPYHELQLPARTDVHYVVRDFSNRYWLSTFSGIMIYTPEDQSLYPVTDSTFISLTSILSIDSSIIFASPQKGLHRGWANDNSSIEFEAIDNVPKDGWYSPVLKDHRGRIWADLLLREFRVFDPLTFQQLATIPLNGFPNALITSSDSSTLWITASTGLFEVDDRELRIQKTHNSYTGFPANNIVSILKDEEKLWLGHPSGLIAFDPLNGVTRSYTYEHGLSTHEYTNAAFKSSDGSFWFGHHDGVTRFSPDQVKDYEVLSIPQITDLNLNDRVPVDPVYCRVTGATHFPAIQKLCLEFKRNTLSFTIHSLGFGAPASNDLRYKMEGLDEGFVQSKNGSIVRYPSMPPGNYRFVLYAGNPDGIENPEPRVLLITILPPYYKTWWFISLTSILILLVLAYIFYLRVTKKLELQNVRLKLYENLHDDVGSRLTAIVLSAEDLERNEHLDHPRIKSISQVAKSIVSNMRRLVWAIDPENDRLNNIIQKINHDKSLILGEEIDFQIEVDERLKNQVVPGEIRYQMSSISNEAFTNIVKYANATRVTVRISKENKHLKLVIQDNGIGFNPDHKEKSQVTGSGYGLANMHRRASRVGGTLSIRSTPGEGSVIEFLIPFKG